MRKCRGCLACDLQLTNTSDISYGILTQMILMDDESLLDSKFIWDQAGFEKSKQACKTINLQKVIEGLRHISVEISRSNDITETDL